MAELVSIKLIIKKLLDRKKAEEDTMVGFSSINNFIYLFIAFSYKLYGENICDDVIECWDEGPISKYLHINHTSNPEVISITAHGELRRDAEEVFEYTYYRYRNISPRSLAYNMRSKELSWYIKMSKDCSMSDSKHQHLTKEDFQHDLDYLLTLPRMRDL